ncbi:hypothetical protein [Oenococcus oeni]|nr:hypothetical protein [Oenococcus oeni]SYW12309.1 conserved hypothetical protein [Oenococcus oeni]SYW14220.1 conserved hypothetical protein [Oenococcus oeni]SYW16132.1 conserved hypothetical protein [Oenococcus oeni]SYW19552.1 conserved hypothetical protein [Oenococcus oeni]VDB98465.1 conserved protein of unknown function [Oenococcus oeni]
MYQKTKFYPVTFRRRDVLQYFSISPRTFDKLTQKAQIKPIIWGSLKLYKTADMLALMERKQIK